MENGGLIYRGPLPGAVRRMTLPDEIAVCAVVNFAAIKKQPMRKIELVNSTERTQTFSHSR
jgi:hypothetical protein